MARLDSHSIFRFRHLPSTLSTTSTATHHYHRLHATKSLSPNPMSETGAPQSVQVHPSLEVIEGGCEKYLPALKKNLEQPYIPAFPIIGWNRHVETIIASFYFPVTSEVKFRRECLRTKDDGAIALDWIAGDDRKLPPFSPILILLHNIKVSDVGKLDKRAATMLEDLHRKEQETHEILKELELTKRLVEELKLKVPKDEADDQCNLNPCLGFDRQVSTPNNEFVNKYPVDSAKQPTIKNEEQLNLFPSTAAGLIMMELKQAKHNLYQNTNDLAELRASVEILSKKLEREKASVELQTSRSFTAAKQDMRIRNEAENMMGGSFNPLAISRELRELNYEAEQFMKTAEAARSEVLKAMSDVEQTKTGLKVIEMRWVVAKKLEDAAKAAESLALAEIRALSSSNEVSAFEGYNQQKPGRISLSIEEYSALTDKAQKAENLFKRREMDAFSRKIEEVTEEKLSKMGFRNSFHSRTRRDSRLLDLNEPENTKNDQRKPVTRQTTSIGDILSRKLVLRDDLEVGGQEEGGGGRGRQRVSLNQMLRRHRGESTPPKRREKDGNEGKNFFSKRKALGFVHISLPMSKQNKNKVQALNFWRGDDE